MTAPMPATGTLVSEAQAITLATALGVPPPTAQKLALAELIISLRTGCDISDVDIVDNMDVTDRYWLAQGVVFQAIWLKDQPDLLSRLDVNQTSTDGDAFNVNHDGLILAPLAKWAILKTSLMTWDTADISPARMDAATRDLESIGWRRWRVGGWL